MGKVKIFEMTDLMPTYWTDEINTILLSSTNQGNWKNQNNSQTKEMELPKRKLVEIIRIIRDSTKSKELKNHYKNKCQICNEALITRDGLYSEVHHLQPLGGDHKGPDEQMNMIVVCPNHHALFDAGAIAIVPETLKIITFNGNEIGSLSQIPNHIIHENFIRYHFEKRFRKIS